MVLKQLNNICLVYFDFTIVTVILEPVLFMQLVRFKGIPCK